MSAKIQRLNEQLLRSGRSTWIVLFLTLVSLVALSSMFEKVQRSSAAVPVSTPLFLPIIEMPENEGMDTGLREFRSEAFGFRFLYDDQLRVWYDQPWPDFPLSFYFEREGEDPSAPEFTGAVWLNPERLSGEAWVALHSDGGSGVPYASDVKDVETIATASPPLTVFRYSADGIPLVRVAVILDDYILALAGRVSDSHDPTAELVRMLATLTQLQDGESGDRVFASAQSTDLQRALAARVAAIHVDAVAQSAAYSMDAYYKLPWDPGVSYSVTQGNSGTSHIGTGQFAYDFGMPDNTPIKAAYGGKVFEIYKGNPTQQCGGRNTADSANRVVINHPDGTATLYLHLSSVDVSEGQDVYPGQHIGYSGHSGYTDPDGDGHCGPHIHFQRQVQTTDTESEYSYYQQSVDIRFVENPDGPLAAGNKPTSLNYGPTFEDGNGNPVLQFFGKPAWLGSSYRQVNLTDEIRNLSSSFNNFAYSLGIPEGYAVTVFQEAGGGGANKTFYASDWDLRDDQFVLSNQSMSVAGNISSYRLQRFDGCAEPTSLASVQSCDPKIPPPPPPPVLTERVRLYDHSNYEGEIGNYGIGTTNDPNANSYSMLVSSGMSVKTYSEDNQGGESRCWSGSVPNLQDHGWHLKIRSLEVFSYDTCPAPLPPGATWEAKFWRSATCYDDHSQCTDGNTTYHTNYSVPGQVDGRKYIIKQDWGQDSPGGSTPNDEFTGYFRATMNFAPGNYVFYSTNDDGLKFKIPGYGEYSTSRDNREENQQMCSGEGQSYYLDGSYTLEAYLREGGGDATIQIWYDNNTDACTPPVLQWPEGDSAISTNMPVFGWEGKAWGPQYTIAVDGIEYTTSSDFFTPVTPLTYGTHTWRVRAKNPYGGQDSPWSETRQFTVQPPAPTGVQASDGIYMDMVQVSWEAVSGASSYEVYRAASSTDTKTKLATVNSASYSDSSVPIGTSYYWVNACSGTVCSTFSSYDFGFRSRPPHDDFYTPQVISEISYSDMLGTENATTDLDDPVIPCVSEQKYNSVWYRYIPSANGRLLIDTYGSDYDTVLAVWTGVRGVLQHEGCNNDANGTTQSEADVPVVAGTSYYIEVTGYMPDSYGALTLSVSFTSPPPTPNTPTPGATWEAKFWRSATCYDDHSQCTDGNTTYHTNYSVPGQVDGRKYIIKQDWGQDSPGGSTPNDEFTGYFRATMNFAPGNYVFYSTNDDGLKFKIPGYGEYSTSRDNREENQQMCSGEGQSYYLDGSYTLEAYLREGGGDATIQIWYDNNTDACTPPVLQWPEGDSAISTNMPVFGWEGKAWGPQYTIAVDGIEYTTSSDFFIPVTPLTYGTHTWRVRAKNPYGGQDSPWSETRQFTVQPPAPVTPTPVTPTPDQYVVSGSIYEDVNRNGQQDVGERGIANAQIYLRSSQLSAAQEWMQYTDAKGIYQFNDVPSGSYDLGVKLPPQYADGTVHWQEVAVDRNPRIVLPIGVLPNPNPNPDLDDDIFLFLPDITYREQETLCGEIVFNRKIWQGDLVVGCDTTTLQAGRAALHLHAATPSIVELYSPLLVVQPNTSYQVSYWVKSDIEIQGAETYGRVIVAEYNSVATENDELNENRISAGFNLGVNAERQTDWVKQSYTFQTRANTAYVRLRAVMGGPTGTASGSIWFSTITILQD